VLYGPSNTQGAPYRSSPCTTGIADAIKKRLSCPFSPEQIVFFQHEKFNNFGMNTVE